MIILNIYKKKLYIRKFSFLYSDMAANAKTANSSSNKMSEKPSASTEHQNFQDTVISLNEIQKAEEQKLRRAVNPIIKPLHILNVSFLH